MEQKGSRPGTPESRSEPFSVANSSSETTSVEPIQIWVRVEIQGKRYDPSFRCEFSLTSPGDNTGSAQTRKSDKPLPGVDLTKKEKVKAYQASKNSDPGTIISYKYDSYCTTKYSGKS